MRREPKCLPTRSPPKAKGTAHRTRRWPDPCGRQSVAGLLADRGLRLPRKVPRLTGRRAEQSTLEEAGWRPSGDSALNCGALPSGGTTRKRSNWAARASGEDGRRPRAGAGGRSPCARLVVGDDVEEPPPRMKRAGFIANSGEPFRARYAGALRASARTRPRYPAPIDDEEARDAGIPPSSISPNHP